MYMIDIRVWINLILKASVFNLFRMDVTMYSPVSTCIHKSVNTFTDPDTQTKELHVNMHLIDPYEDYSNSENEYDFQYFYSQASAGHACV